MSNISVKNVCKSFSKIEVLKSVGIEIKDKEFVVLLGPSGCGKSTLLRIIAGLETETSGDVFIGERQVNGLSPRDRRLAMVFQNYAVFPHMTVAQNIGFGLEMQKAPKEKIKRKVQETAELMHIEQYLHRYSGQLSGGQRQRVAVARALATEPDVLLMDEPLSNLDALLRLEMRAELKTILDASQTTTIYVTHDQVEAMSLADRIAVMYKGVIQQYDEPAQIYNNPSTEFVGGFIGSPPMNFMNAETFKFNHAPTAALKAGVRPENLTVTRERQEGSWEAKVTVIEALGSHLQIMTKIFDQNIRINVANELGVSIGDTVYVKPQADKVKWYSEEGVLVK